MLSDEDLAYVVEEVTKFIRNSERPREMLLNGFLGTAFSSDLISGSAAEIVKDAMRLCLVDRWNNTPPWMVRLINVVDGQLQTPKLLEIRERVRVEPPAPPNRVLATVLDNGTPFVNRSLLRTRLQRLASASAATRPILVVNGAPQSGKSYSTQYINHFSILQPPATPTITYRYELRAGMELETGPEEVATELVGSMGRTFDRKPPQTTNQKLYVRQLALWVLNEAVQNATQQHWIVLDNFQGEKLRPDTRDFVVALADRVTNGVFPKQCRLILIGFDRSQLTVDPGQVDEERIVACKQVDIDACVREIAARAPQPPPLALPPLMIFVTGALPQGAGLMRELNTRLRGLLLAIEQIAEIIKNLNFQFEEVLHRILKDLPSGDELLPELERRLDALRDTVTEVA